MPAPARQPRKVTVRRVSPDDLPAVTALVERSWRATNEPLLPPETVAALTADHAIASVLTSHMSDLWLAETEGAVAGAFGADATGHIWAFYVDPDRRREGIGTALYEVAMKHLANQDLEQASLDVIAGNEGAEAFYTAKGWREDGRRNEALPGHTCTAIRMVYDLV